MKAIAYYRVRPSSPEASASAFRTQLEAVRQCVEEDGLTLVAEFVEKEGEAGSHGYPAYVAALQTALAHKESDGLVDVAVVTASRTPIAEGPEFHPPDVPGAHLLLHIDIEDPFNVDLIERAKLDGHGSVDEQG